VERKIKVADIPPKRKADIYEQRISESIHDSKNKSAPGGF